MEIPLGVQNIYLIEIAYMSKNDAESKIHKKNRITQERRHPQNYLL